MVPAARTSEGVARAITYIGYAWCALVLFVIWQELRAAGLWAACGARPRRKDPAAEWRRRLMLADVLAAPLAERPGMLLRLLGEALTRAQRLPAADGLTAGAIVRRANLDADADRAALARVAATAEECVTPRNHRPTKPRGSVSGAAKLLGRLGRSTGGRR